MKIERIALCVVAVYLDVFQGLKSSNPLAFKWYNAEEEILGEKGDPFGAPTKFWPERMVPFSGHGREDMKDIFDLVNS